MEVPFVTIYNELKSQNGGGAAGALTLLFG